MLRYAEIPLAGDDCNHPHGPKVKDDSYGSGIRLDVRLQWRVSLMANPFNQSERSHDPDCRRLNG